MQNPPLSDLNTFGYQIINFVELFIPFNWAIAMVSAIACMAAVYVMGQLYKWGWRILAASLAGALALNVATPLITPQPPWVSSLFLSLSNLVCLIAIAIRLHRAHLI